MIGDLLRVKEKKFSKIIQVHIFKDIDFRGYNIFKELILYILLLGEGLSNLNNL